MNIAQTPMGVVYKADVASVGVPAECEAHQRVLDPGGELECYSIFTAILFMRAEVEVFVVIKVSEIMVDVLCFVASY